MSAMDERGPIARFFNLPKVNWGLFLLGLLLLLMALIVGPLPGPGGIFFAVPGLAFMLRSSWWAKRHYVRVKKWQPKAGRWMDWTLRRKSAARRAALVKAENGNDQPSGN